MGVRVGIWYGGVGIGVGGHDPQRTRNSWSIGVRDNNLKMMIIIITKLIIKSKPNG